jgi:hypothetical protein
MTMGIRRWRGTTMAVTAALVAVAGVGVGGAASAAPSHGDVPRAVAAGASDPDEAFVTQLYEDLLGRAPDEQGLRHWVAVVRDPGGEYEGSSGRGYAAYEFMRSEEYLGKVITASYDACLHRAPDTEGMEYWLKRLRVDLWTSTRMNALLLGSGEYIGKNPDWVGAVYRDVLGRSASASEKAHWMSVVERENFDGAADGILRSEEHSMAVLDGVYQKLLSRPADAVGRGDFLWMLQDGYPLEWIIADIVASSEYAARAESR